MNKSDSAFLKVEDLVVEYKTGGRIVHAVNGVSFALERGETLGLVGETGAGKTTIAKAILRVLPDAQARVGRGRIVLEGTDLLKLGEPAMRKVRGGKVTMVFQDPMTALNPIMKVGEQISEVVRKHQTLKDRTSREIAGDMLEMVGIPRARYNEYPHQFSGGMKQRVVIAMALACNPQLLLADEPTTALDVTIQAQVLDMIDDLKKRHNTSMILITHDLGVVARMCEQVAVVYAGEIVECGSREEVFLHPSHPYTIGLFGAIPDLSVDTSRLANIEGLPPDPTDLPGGCCFHPRCPHATDRCRKEKPAFAEVRPGHFCSCCYVAADQKEV
ncbi:MAG: ABC transporter ATP-binding protein [Lachnospiraceae bacterium]|nr:ABC transporter ATP-binding protein [Lachnospiraceae bacterium]